MTMRLLAAEMTNRFLSVEITMPGRRTRTGCHGALRGRNTPPYLR
jgi:hypothetical protein